MSITRDQFIPSVAATVIWHLARKYNGARIAVERLGIGHHVLSTLQGQYRYGNIWVDLDGRPGFKTTEPSKKHILAQLQQALNDGLITIPHIGFLQEMDTFKITEKGRAEAAKDTHDDMIMSVAVGVHNFFTTKPQLIDPDNIEQPVRKRKLVVR